MDLVKILPTLEIEYTDSGRTLSASLVKNVVIK
jgi:hypothetical protein